MAVGGSLTYDLINDNPGIERRTADYINGPRVIGQNDNVASVNAMIVCHLADQVNAEFLAHQFSAVGKQLDFVRGAYSSKGGRFSSWRRQRLRTARHHGLCLG